MFNDEYFTLAQNAEATFKDKGSKFIAYSYTVSTEEECKMHIADLKKQHPTAGHFCYGYIIGALKQHQRANDDGEPSNTAGKPILNQLLSANVTNVLVVVVRYFGGTLLGVSGLINAYKTAAQAVIQASGKELNYRMHEATLSFGFDDTQQAMLLLKQHEAKINAQNYDASTVHVQFMYRASVENNLLSKIASHHKLSIKLN
jgi:uncharacterized YigZ family protein